MKNITGQIKHINFKEAQFEISLLKDSVLETETVRNTYTVGENKKAVLYKKRAIVQYSTTLTISKNSYKYFQKFKNYFIIS